MSTMLVYNNAPMMDTLTVLRYAELQYSKGDGKV